VRCSDETDADGWPQADATAAAPPVPPTAPVPALPQPTPAPRTIPSGAVVPTPVTPTTPRTATTPVTPLVTPAPEVTPTPPAPPAAPAPERIQFTPGASAPVITAPGGGLISGYGYRTDPFNQTTAFHPGVDIAAPKGTAVHTPGPGVVTFAGVSGGNGRMVEVALDTSHTVRFTHLNEISVVIDQTLKAGDAVGTVGSTGRSSGPHLHFEIYRDGKSLDPLTIQGLNLTAGPLVTPAPSITPVAPSAAPAAPALEPIRFSPDRSAAGERVSREPRAPRAKNSTCVAELAGRTTSHYAGLDAGTPLAPQALRQDCSRAYVGDRNRIRSRDLAEQVR
jgi:murein DD-endopeptidase MepM/ murein hydrolase activator NlpD